VQGRLGLLDRALKSDAEQHGELRGLAAEPLGDRQDLRPDLLQVEQGRVTGVMARRRTRHTESGRPGRFVHIAEDVLEVGRGLAGLLDVSS